MKTLSSLWRSYRDDVVPDSAPAVQVQETRRASYAGAFKLTTIEVCAIFITGCLTGGIVGVVFGIGAGYYAAKILIG